MIRRFALGALLPLTLIAAAPAPSPLDAIGEAFVHLTLEAGEREAGYVDAYYGPAEWQAAAKANPRDVATLLKDADALQAKLSAIDPASLSTGDRRRHTNLVGQVRAAQTRLAMMQGKKFKFADEAELLFGVRPQLKPLTSYDAVLARIDALVPGPGPLAARVGAEAGEFTVPAEKAEAVMRAAIAECRARTFKHFGLPANENFKLSFVANKSWAAYNWYKGDSQSLIEVNTDIPLTIGRAIDLGCHEGYPGHHVYMSRLEANLIKKRNWVEFSVYPLYSPQSFIAEGSANAGIKLAFPGEEQAAFEAKTLYPLAGLSPNKAAKHDAVLKAVEELKGAALTIQQMYLDGEVTREQAVPLFAKYALSSPELAAKQLDFADQYRSYVINYSVGADMVTAALQAGGASQEERWKRMERILSEPTVPADLR